MDGGAGRGGDDAQVSHRGGQRLLARGVEQPLGQQAGLEFLEGRLQRACPGGLEVLDNQLELAAALVQRHPAAQPYRVTVLWRELQPLVAVPEHRTPHLGAAVFQ